MTFHDRWIAASRAEDNARRQEASTLLSGVVMTLVLGTAIFWMSIFAGRI